MMDSNARRFSLSAYFAVLLRPQTYLNLMYLLLAFPLGILYFVLYSIGLSLGLSLLVILVGIPILIAMFAMTWGLAVFERRLNHALLGRSRPQDTAYEEPDDPVFSSESLMAYIRGGAWLRHSLYLGLKMPFGVLSFTLAVTVLTFGVALMGVPLSANVITTADVIGSLIAAAMGLALLPLGLHACNWLAQLWRSFGESLLWERPHEVVIPAKGKGVYVDDSDPFAAAGAGDKRKLADLITDDPFYADDDDQVHLARPLHDHEPTDDRAGGSQRSGTR